MRTAGALWESLTADILPRFGREGVARHVCSAGGAAWSSRAGNNYIACKTHNRGRQPRHRFAALSSSIIASIVAVHSQTVPLREITSSIPGPHSHMTWALDAVANLAHLPAPAPSIETRRHAEAYGQSRRHREHAGDGHEREEEEPEHQARRRKRRAARPKASMRRQPHQAGWRRQRRTRGNSGQAQEEPEDLHAALRVRLLVQDHHWARRHLDRLTPHLEALRCLRRPLRGRRTRRAALHSNCVLTFFKMHLVTRAPFKNGVFCHEIVVLSRSLC